MSPAASRLKRRELAAWVGLLRAHSSLTRELERELLERHEITLSDYDVLVQLDDAPGGEMRPIELSRAILLTRSGVTRLVQGMERAGLVERVECPDDRRGSLVRLTDAGLELRREAGITHRDGVRRLFAAKFGPEELETLGELLGRLDRASA